MSYDISNLGLKGEKKSRTWLWVVIAVVVIVVVAVVATKLANLW